MRRWTCISCGAVERLTITPDCCSSCGGSMTDDEGRSTLSSDWLSPEELEAHYQDMDRIYEEFAAEQGDPESVIRVWQRGNPLTRDQQDIVDAAMRQNAMEMALQCLGLTLEVA